LPVSVNPATAAARAWDTVLLLSDLKAPPKRCSVAPSPLPPRAGPARRAVSRA